MVITTIITLLLIALILLTITLWFIDKPENTIITIPIAIVLFIILTTCTINIPITDPKSYGYTSDGYLLTSGYNSLKFPWIGVDIMQNYPHNTNIEIPCQTTDGMRLLFIFPIYRCVWDPMMYGKLYNHDEDYFKRLMVQQLQPTVTRIMSTKTEVDIELRGGDTASEIRAALVTIVKHPGLTRTADAKYDYGGYFQHLDDPQYNYACMGIGGGYCGDDLSADTYQPGMVVPNRITETPTMTPRPTMVYIDDSNAPETQADVNAIIDQCLADPACGG